MYVDEREKKSKKKDRRKLRLGEGLAMGIAKGYRCYRCDSSQEIEEKK